MMHSPRCRVLFRLTPIVIVFLMTDVGCALSAEPRHHYCVSDPLTFVLAGSSYPEVLKHHDISGRLRAFLKADKTVEHFTFERHTGYSALDRAALNNLAGWRFAKAGSCDIVTIPFTFTLKSRNNDLTTRCSQPLIGVQPQFLMTKSRSFQASRAAISGG
jgi:hypothetical protein